MSAPEGDTTVAYLIAQAATADAVMAVYDRTSQHWSDADFDAAMARLRALRADS